MQLMVYIYHGIVFFNNDNLKYTATFQRRLLILSPYFTFFSFIVFFLCYLFSNSHAKRNIASIIYVAYCIL